MDPGGQSPSPSQPISLAGLPISPSTHQPICPSGTTIVYLIKIKQIMLTNWISWLALCAGRSRGDLLNNPCNINRVRPRPESQHKHTRTHTHSHTHPHMTWLSLGSSPSEGQSIWRGGGQQKKDMTWKSLNLLGLWKKQQEKPTNRAKAKATTTTKKSDECKRSEIETESETETETETETKTETEKPFRLPSSSHSLHT